MQAISLTHSQLRLPHPFVMAKQPDEEFGKRLQQLIDESRLSENTQAEIALRFGVSPPMVTNYLQGVKLPSIPTARRMAMELGCCVDYLLTGRTPKRPGDLVGENCIVFDLSQIPKDRQGRFKEALHAVAQSVGEMMADYGSKKD
jgi:transcriptional regulator with XRE-family HTH domain